MDAVVVPIGQVDAEREAHHPRVGGGLVVVDLHLAAVVVQNLEHLVREPGVGGRAVGGLRVGIVLVGAHDRVGVVDPEGALGVQAVPVLGPAADVEGEPVVAPTGGADGDAIDRRGAVLLVGALPEDAHREDGPVVIRGCGQAREGQGLVVVQVVHGQGDLTRRGQGRVLVDHEQGRARDAGPPVVPRVRRAGLLVGHRARSGDPVGHRIQGVDPGVGRVVDQRGPGQVQPVDGDRALQIVVEPVPVGEHHGVDVGDRGRGRQHDVVILLGRVPRRVPVVGGGDAVAVHRHTAGDHLLVDDGLGEGDGGSDPQEATGQERECQGAHGFPFRGCPSKLA